MNLGTASMGSDFNSTMVGAESFKMSSGTGAALAGGALAVSSSSGSGNMARCPLDDQSFYCQLSRGTNIVSMIIYLVFIFIVVIMFLYFLYDYMRSGSSRGKSNSGKGRR
jgi:heme/copper-type cytochrome/quinol oxidase subunit 2